MTQGATERQDAWTLAYWYADMLISMHSCTHCMIVYNYAFCADCASSQALPACHNAIALQGLFFCVYKAFSCGMVYLPCLACLALCRVFWLAMDICYLDKLLFACYPVFNCQSAMALCFILVLVSAYNAFSRIIGTCKH